MIKQITTQLKIRTVKPSEIERESIIKFSRFLHVMNGEIMVRKMINDAETTQILDSLASFFDDLYDGESGGSSAFDLPLN